VHAGDMPNTELPATTDERYEEKEKLAQEADIHITVYSGIGPKTSPLKKDSPDKMYLGANSDPDKPSPYVKELDFYSKEEVEAAMPRYKRRKVSIHLEDSFVLAQSKDALTHEERRPPEAEITATEWVIPLIKKNNIKAKLCHFSTKAGLEKVIEARKDGADITVEVTPHHLYFDTSMITDENRKWLQMNPPLRSPEDRLYLIEALRNGDIDYLASDHAPHTREEKMNGMSGVPHLDTFGGFTTWLMAEHNFTPQDIARVCAYNPGQFVKPFLPESLGKGFGKIEEGYVGSFTVINPHDPVTITKDHLKTKCGWSPFEGHEFPGKVVDTWIKGKRYKTAY